MGKRSPATGYYNAGQDCTAADARARLEGRLRRRRRWGSPSKAQSLVIGDTLSPDTTLGPVNSAENSSRRVEGSSNASPGPRRRIVTGGKAGAAARLSSSRPHGDRGAWSRTMR